MSEPALHNRDNQPESAAVVSEGRNDRRKVATVCRTLKIELAKSLFDAIQGRYAASGEESSCFLETSGWWKEHFLTAADLIERWLATSEGIFLDLFVGFVSSQLPFVVQAGASKRTLLPQHSIELAKEQWSALLKDSCSERALAVFNRDLEEIIIRLKTKPLKRMNLLVIGDCLQLELMSVLSAACLKIGISVQHTLLNERVQPVLRNNFRSLNPDEFDLVFFAPFSYSYLPGYSQLISSTSVSTSASQISERAAALCTEVATTLSALLSHFSAPVYVHNTAGVVQTFAPVSGFLKNLTAVHQSSVCETIRDKIEGCVTQANANTSGRAHVLDEHSLAKQEGRFSLGRVYINSYSFHPTRMAVALGRTLYCAAVYAQAYLVGKKVIVCDLDNTLWEGIAGEEAVRHLLDRQKLLKTLSRKGVLLSINSKNDASNIMWEGGSLCNADFVAAQINWEPKHLNIARIRDELNLSTADFVFIDDRPDELERVGTVFPEIHTLDARAPLTWTLLAEWEKLLAPSTTTDRTQLYKQKSQREQFLKQLSTGTEVVCEEAAALKALMLTVRIREAKRNELNRIVDLINRTNQFNLCGTRTSLRDLRSLAEDSGSILVAEASDKFGAMGIISAMVIHWLADSAHIPIFILSCRAFGFGIEYALLNSLKYMAPAISNMVGYYEETPSNGACRRLYPESRMTWDGQFWRGDTSQLPADPDWLTIERQITTRSAAH